MAQTGILMTAGQDTVTNTMVFGCWELARHPEFQSQLRAELEASRRGTSQALNYESMPLLNAFIKAFSTLTHVKWASSSMHSGNTYALPTGSHRRTNGCQRHSYTSGKGYKRLCRSSHEPYRSPERISRPCGHRITSKVSCGCFPRYCSIPFRFDYTESNLNGVKTHTSSGLLVGMMEP